LGKELGRIWDRLNSLDVLDLARVIASASSSGAMPTKPNRRMIPTD